MVNTVRRRIMPGWTHTLIASGEKRDQVTAARLKWMGVTPDFPIWCSLARVEACFVELKAGRGRLSESTPASGHAA
jgi:hypothetical protein